MASNEYDLGYTDGLGDGVEDAKKLYEQTKKLVADFTKVAEDIAVNSKPVMTAPPSKADKTLHRVVSIGCLLLNVPLAIYQAWVASKLWSWFVLPNFARAPHLTTIDFMGLAVLVGLSFLFITITLGIELMNKDESLARKTEKTLGRTIAWWLLVSLSLLMGFIYHLFM